MLIREGQGGRQCKSRRVEKRGAGKVVREGRKVRTRGKEGRRGVRRVRIIGQVG
jgi:hypothetical protein